MRCHRLPSEYSPLILTLTPFSVLLFLPLSEAVPEILCVSLQCVIKRVFNRLNRRGVILEILRENQPEMTDVHQTSWATAVSAESMDEVTRDTTMSRGLQSSECCCREPAEGKTGSKRHHMCPHPPHSLGQASCDFWLSPTSKSWKVNIWDQFRTSRPQQCSQRRSQQRTSRMWQEW